MDIDDDGLATVVVAVVLAMSLDVNDYDGTIYPFVLIIRLFLCLLVVVTSSSSLILLHDLQVLSFFNERFSMFFLRYFFSFFSVVINGIDDGNDDTCVIVQSIYLYLYILNELCTLLEQSRMEKENMHLVHVCCA